MSGDGAISPHSVLLSGSEATETWIAEAERIVPPAVDRLVLAGLAPRVCEVSVMLVSDTEIRDLNRRYRGKDMATDVLSFPQLEGKLLEAGAWPEGVPYPIGDIVISLPRMIEQADAFGHGQAREFGFLLLHGLLHLLGFDHESPDEASAMREREEDLLAAAGLTRDAGAP